MIGFLRALVRMPPPVLAWVGVLGLANMAALAFLPAIEAVVVLAMLMVGFLAQVAIFRRKGFVRLLGLGHFHWLVMIPWLLTRFDATNPRSAFDYWMLAVVTVDSLSLVIDVADVVRYSRGDTEPQVPQ